MGNRNNYWVVWSKIVWQVKREGSIKAIKNFEVKKDAVDYGIEVARNNQPSQLTIKRKDGTIEKERTYGDDPYPPRG
ncbi:MAG: DUF2188 domain-containing protein [Firmicutes bacterium]|nr:DUF2188 domain-containing protein [Bacillota bacterium]